MKYTALELPGVWLIEPVRHRDARGYFCETFRADSFAEATGLDVDFVQENESESVRGTVRGLHFQAGTSAQAKLVRVCRGAIVDVVVDLRKTSPTFGRHLAVELSDENGRQLFVPRGFAHGFAVVSDTARFLYKVDNYYDPSSERTLLLSDPALDIVWPVADEDMILSEKDKRGVKLEEVETF